MVEKNLIEEKQKRRDYMKKYYRRKKAERIKLGTCISICRGLNKNKSFVGGLLKKKGEFIISFS